MPQLNPEFFISQLFWLLVTFSFLLIFLWKVSLPRISTALKKRETKINEDIASAKKLQEEAEKIQLEIDNQIKKTKNDSAEMVKSLSENLQENSINELSKVDKELNKQINESASVIEKNKKQSLNIINDQIYEITKLTFKKITNFEVDNEEIKNAISSAERKTN